MLKRYNCCENSIYIFGIIPCPVRDNVRETETCRQTVVLPKDLNSLNSYTLLALSCFPNCLYSSYYYLLPRIDAVAGIPHRLWCLLT